MISDKKILLLLLFLFLCFNSIFSQNFAPQVGFNNSDAVHKDRGIIVNWAKDCKVKRGYINISDTTITYSGSNKATFGADSNAIGEADGVLNVVSLGDGGFAELYFNPPIYNGEGFDFAVFENAIIHQQDSSLAFLELAFVEVSSDGQKFYRFPSVSEYPSYKQVRAFDYLDCSYFHNLAGKYPAFYGTPFDLDDLIEFSSELDLNRITHIRIIDVIGTINQDFASFDMFGNIINDPFPTPFNSGGFDLDAVGVINQLVNFESYKKILLYPNPVKDILNIYHKDNIKRIVICDMQKKIIFENEFNSSYCQINLTDYETGVYFLYINSENEILTRKIIKIK